MNLRDKIVNLLEVRIGVDKPIDLADAIIELVANHLNGVQLGLPLDEG